MDVELPSVPSLPGKSDTALPEGSYYERLAREERVEDDTEPSGSRRENRDERDARRMGERLPQGYEPKSGADLTFDPRMAYELALELDSPTEIMERYGVSEARARELISNPAFITTVKKYREEIVAGGVGFRLKAKMQAEDLLTHSYLLATDPEVPASVRADLIKWTAKVADLEPKEKKGEGQGNGFVLNITFTGDRPAATIEGEVTDA